MPQARTAPRAGPHARGQARHAGTAAPPALARAHSHTRARASGLAPLEYVPRLELNNRRCCGHYIMLQLLRALLALTLCASAAATGAASGRDCVTAAGCSLNGLCTAGKVTHAGRGCSHRAAAAGCRCAAASWLRVLALCRGVLWSICVSRPSPRLSVARACPLNVIPWHCLQCVCDKPWTGSSCGIMGYASTPCDRPPPTDTL